MMTTFPRATGNPPVGRIAGQAYPLAGEVWPTGVCSSVHPQRAHESPMHPGPAWKALKRLVFREFSGADDLPPGRAPGLPWTSGGATLHDGLCRSLEDSPVRAPTVRGLCC